MSAPSRRRILRGMLGGTAISFTLPWLEAFAPTAHAGVGGLPLRYASWIWANGNLPDRWTPTGTGEGDDWQLSDQLQPLAPIKHKLTCLSGFQVYVPNTIPHWSGIGGLLCGVNPLGTDSDWTAAAPSLDQILAADSDIGGQTAYRSLEIGIEHDEIFSFTGPNAQQFGEQDPHALFQRLFGDSFREPGQGIVDPRLGYRRSVLDAVLGDLGRLERSLGSEDRERLDKHATAVRDLENRLERLQSEPPNLEACERAAPPEESYPDIDGRPQFSAKCRAMADLSAMALACDMTRVLTLQTHRAVSNPLFVGMSDGHHNQTHNEPAPQPEVHRITLLLMEELSYFLQALDSIDEGEGTLLDNCLVLGTTDTSEGRTHRMDEFPVLLAGSACGKLRTDFHHRSFANDNASRIPLQILQTMGINATEFGVDDAHVTSGLTEILK